MNQQHTFNQYCSSSSSREFTFTQPNKPKTEEEKKKNRYEAVKRHRELMETVKFLENEELKEKENQLRNLEREKSEEIGKIKALSELFSIIVMNNPTYMDKDFHRCRKALFNIANNAEKIT